MLFWDVASMTNYHPVCLLIEGYDSRNCTIAQGSWFPNPHHVYVLFATAVGITALGIYLSNYVRQTWGVKENKKYHARIHWNKLPGNRKSKSLKYYAWYATHINDNLRIWVWTSSTMNACINKSKSTFPFYGQWYRVKMRVIHLINLQVIWETLVDTWRDFWQYTITFDHSSLYHLLLRNISIDI